MNRSVGLGLSTESPPSFESFFVGENEHALQRVREGSRIWLFGEAAVGKTHLIQSLARVQPDALQLTLGDGRDRSEALAPLVLVDDIDTWRAFEAHEYALFEAFESTDFKQTRWVVAARDHPASVKFEFPDLVSRTSLFETIEVRAVPQQQRAALLEFWAKDRSIVLKEGAIRYLLDRIPRTQQHLWETLLRLDEASVLRDRELSIPFIREVLDSAST